MANESSLELESKPKLIQELTAALDNSDYYLDTNNKFFDIIGEYAASFRGVKFMTINLCYEAHTTGCCSPFNIDSDCCKSTLVLDNLAPDHINPIILFFLPQLGNLTQTINKNGRLADLQFKNYGLCVRPTLYDATYIILPIPIIYHVILPIPILWKHKELPDIGTNIYVIDFEKRKVKAGEVESPIVAPIIISHDGTALVKQNQLIITRK